MLSIADAHFIFGMKAAMRGALRVCFGMVYWPTFSSFLVQQYALRTSLGCMNEENIRRIAYALSL